MCTCYCMVNQVTSTTLTSSGLEVQSHLEEDGPSYGHAKCLSSDPPSPDPVRFQIPTNAPLNISKIFPLSCHHHLPPQMICLPDALLALFNAGPKHCFKKPRSGHVIVLFKTCLSFVFFFLRFFLFLYLREGERLPAEQGA